ncbi:MAG: hypothetical protein PHI66_05260 [Candidatus Pacebacteria bacterium]|nr:hypothetical protein [Candidatus Paceibacterota bacterium]
MTTPITWIIPMAGKGTRTQSLGEFKPFVEINESKMITWFLFSIRNNIKRNDVIVFVTTPYFSKKFEVEDTLCSVLKNLKITNKFHLAETQDISHGQSESILSAENIVDKSTTVVVANPDQYIDFCLPEVLTDCYLALYLSLSEKSGFVRIENGEIIHFVEKKNISNLASAGIYIVPKAGILFDAIREQIREGEMVNGEFYLGPVFNIIMKKGNRVKPLEVRAKYDLGNVRDISYFRKRFADNIRILNELQ